MKHFPNIMQFQKVKVIEKTKIFICLNCLHSFRTKTKFEFQKKICKSKRCFDVVMPCEDTMMLEFNQYLKCNKIPFIIYVDL